MITQLFQLRDIVIINIVLYVGENRFLIQLVFQLFRGVAVVEWSSSRPLDCEVRGSNPGQGRDLKTNISASGAPQRW